MRLEYNPLGSMAVAKQMDMAIRTLSDMETVMTEAGALIYAATAQWMDSNGEGSWPKLADSTVARKAQQGRAEPERPLFAEGNLHASATSPTGPYSVFSPGPKSVSVAIHWMDGKSNVARALAIGTRTSGRAHNTKIPARPIFPPITSAAGIQLRTDLKDLIQSSIAAAFPGAYVGRNTRGRFVSLRNMG